MRSSDKVFSIRLGTWGGFGRPFPTYREKGKEFMSNTFTINNKRYKAPVFDFNTVCDFEEAGISLADAKSKPMSMLRMYFTLLFDGDKEAAGKELEEHMIKGGDFSELTNVMIKEMNESRFFQALQKTATPEEETGSKTPSKSKK